MHNKSDSLPLLQALLTRQRWAALATLDRHGLPEGAMVAFVMDTDLRRGYLHLSELAGHTRNLLQRPPASLVISELDTGTGDPQQLARVALQIEVRKLDNTDPVYAGARSRYLAALPDAAMRFEFADFHLFAFEWHLARVVGGFAQAFSFQPRDLD